MDHEGMWDLAFECPACSIESACKMEGWTEKEEELLEMATALQRTYAHERRPATWSLYVRCMHKVIDFMREFKIVVFPVAEDGNATGLALFFQHLKLQGVSWAKMAHFRSALVAASVRAKFGDPWARFSQLKSLTTGLSKELRTTVRRKEGFTIAMVMRIIDYLDKRIALYDGTKNQRCADKAVRDKVAIMCGFWGLRRGSECWVNKKRDRGFLKSMVRVVVGHHVTLCVQGMKNDASGRGTEIVLAWVSGSGAKIGESFVQLLALLDKSGIRGDQPLFCSTRQGGGFSAPGPGKESRFQGILAGILPKIWEEFGDKVMRERFTWHSLRRGGATWAWNQGVARQLIMGQGGWRSEAGFSSYAVSDLEGKLSVTRRM